MFNFEFMKKISYYVTCLSILLLFIACKTHKKLLPNTQKQEFKNQGEQEAYWTKTFFEKNYKKEKIKRYSGHIQIAGDSIIYGKEVLIVDDTSENKAIFSNGLLYPALLVGYDLKVYEVTLLPSLSHSVKIKRFELFSYSTMRFNSTVCFFELTNNKATAQTSIGDFIKDARLTFFKEGWIEM